MRLRVYSRIFKKGLSTSRHVENADVVVIGGGPAGLSAAIRLKQLSAKKNKDLRVIVLEKGPTVGSHILSGAVIEPSSLDYMLPNWKEGDLPSLTPATKDSMLFLTKTSSFPIPHPPQMTNKGNYIVSLSELVVWLGKQAEDLGVELYPGFAASEILYDKARRVVGVTTNDVGLAKDGSKKPSYESGIEIRANLSVFSEGCHGSLAKELIKKFDLRDKSKFQTYGLGIKEIWEIKPENHQLGLVQHTIGWPLDPDTYGGSFIYHIKDNKLSMGLVVGLDYENPYINPYKEFQRFKHHPNVKRLLEGGKCISYGARALNEGGLQSVPRLVFPGGILIGCSAGFLNVPKIKGSHLAMKSGILAAEAYFEEKGFYSTRPLTLHRYNDKVRESNIWKELKEVRNVRPAFKNPFGMLGFLAYSGFETVFLKGRVPWTLQHHKPDHECLKTASEFPPIDYPKPDGVISFDLLENLARTGTNHTEDQPVHLKLANEEIPVNNNLSRFLGPESRYCPAGVYEFVENPTTKGMRLQINPQNCIHCKTCDIKDPTQNINWVPPEGGGGPKYSGT